MKNELNKYKEEAEKLIDTNPELLLRKIKQIVFWSYVYFGFLLVFGVYLCVLLFVSIFIAGATSVFLFAIAVTMVHTLIKGIFFKVGKVSGYEIQEQDFPEFFAALKDIESKLSVKVDTVYIDQVFNAGVTQVPRFGFFGGYKNILCIGLPYMLFMSEGEMKSVLAHELAHLSTDDSKSTSSINQIRTSWIRMIEHIGNNKRRGNMPIIFFLEKVWPKLDIYTFAYSRHKEFKADTFAAQYSGVMPWAEHLVKAHVGTLYIDSFWEKISCRIYKDAVEPPKDFFDELFLFFKKPVEEKKISEWVARATFRQTDMHDTHPSLEDRLKFQNVDSSIGAIITMFNSSVDISSAQILLGKKYREVVNHFNSSIKDSFLKDWQKYVDYSKKLNEIIGKVEEDEKKINWKKIQAYIERDGIESTTSLIEDLYRNNSEDSSAIFYHAVVLLGQSNLEGEKLLMELYHSKKIKIETASRYLFDFYVKMHMREKADELRSEIQKELETNQKTKTEIEKFSQEDELVEAVISEEAVAIIKEKAESIPEIMNVYIAKKILKADPEIETYVIAVYPRFNNFDSTKDSETIKKFVEINIPFHARCFVVRARLEDYGKKVKNINNSLVYKREVN